MSLIPRLIIGQRSASNTDVGVWLSKRGVNARTASVDDLLISPTDPALSFLAVGIASAAKGATAIVRFNSNAASRVPVVFFQTSRNGVGHTPEVTTNEYSISLGQPPFYRIDAELTLFRLVNTANAGFTGRYMVTSLPL